MELTGYCRPMLRRLALLAPWFLVGLACTPSPQPRGEPSFDAAALMTCEAAFRAWVDAAASLNSPGVELGEALVAQEVVERRVFELCSLAEAERYNRDLLVELAPGVRETLIKPDFRTFAMVECVDESPLLDGTPLCAEVGR